MPCNEMLSNIKLIRDKIDDYPDFPKPGILFKDIFGVLKDPEAFKALRDVILDHVSKICPPIQAVVGLDARGFLFGPIVSLHLNIPFIPIRKKGKLPGKTHSFTYELEYGQDTLEIQQGNLAKGTRILVIDDLLATGGTLMAACKLLEQEGFEIVECFVVMELKALDGKSKISAPIHSIIQY